MSKHVWQMFALQVVAPRQILYSAPCEYSNHIHTSDNNCTSYHSCAHDYFGRCLKLPS